MVKCNGEERHRHTDLTNSRDLTHIHKHSIQEKGDLNRIHHHPPLDHMGFTDAELEATMEIIQIEY